MYDVEFFVRGRAYTKGSPRVVTRNRRGQPLAKPIVTSDSENSWKWQAEVAKQSAIILAGVQVPPPKTPLNVQLIFGEPRPKHHYSKGDPATGKLVPSAPSHPTNLRDLDKLCRSTLDGLAGVAFADDKDIVELMACKVYSPRRMAIGVIVRVTEINADHISEAAEYYESKVVTEPEEKSPAVKRRRRR